MIVSLQSNCCASSRSLRDALQKEPGISPLPIAEPAPAGCVGLGVFVGHLAPAGAIAHGPADAFHHVSITHAWTAGLGPRFRLEEQPGGLGATARW